MYVLGIDGGGTKTAAVMTDIKGNVIATATVGATNPNGVGYEKAEAELIVLLKKIEQQNSDAFSKITHAFAGMSGVDRPEDKIRMTAVYQSLLPEQCVCMVDNDATNALYSGTYGEPGVVHISGTGSITYGITKQNDRSRVGGWGFLLGDPGSGFSIGRNVLNQVFAEYDGYGEPTLLTPLIKEKTGITSIPDLVPIMYHSGQSRESIASFSRLAVTAAELGDAVAQSVLQTVGQEMGTSIKHLLEKLFSKEERKDVPIVLAGGVYHNAACYLPFIQRELKTLQVEPTFVIPSLPPVSGSVFAALKEANQKPIDESIQKNFKHSFYQMDAVLEGK